MSIRPQPAHIKWPFDEQTAEGLEKCFRTLFQDTKQLVEEVVPVARGGTGQTTFAAGDLLYASLEDVLAGLAISATAGRFLRTDGSLPAWSTLVLPNAATTGDILYASATNVTSMLAGVATGNALISGGVATTPSWGKIGLTTHVSGILPIVNGGTNNDSFSSGSIVFFDGTRLEEDNGQLFWDTTNNDLLLGTTTTPMSSLSLQGRGLFLARSSAAELNVLAAGTSVFSGLRLTATGGTVASPSATASGQGGFIGMQGYGTAYTLTKVAISLYAAEAWTASAQGTRIGFEVTPTGATTRTERIRIQPSGGLSIGNAILSTDPGEGGLALGTVLDEIYGGTGQSTFTQGDLLYSSAANTLAKLAKDANATRYLSNTGASNNPAWAQVALATGVSGDLPFANLTQASAASRLLGRGSAAGAGDYEEITIGSGLTMTATTLSANAGGTNALLDGASHSDTVAQGVTRGSLVYGNVTPAWDELVIGAANRVLRSDGTDVAWAQVALATDVSGTLPVGNGGTGATTFTSNGVLYGNTTGAIQVTAQGVANSVLTANAGAPAFSATPTVTSLTTTADLTVGDQLVVSGVGPHVIGGASLPTRRLASRGNFDATGLGDHVSALYIDGTITVDPGSRGNFFEFNPTIATGTSGADHPGIAGLLVNAPNITFNGTAVTTSATLWVTGNPTTGATNNYALFVGGAIRFSDFGAGAATFDASGNISSVSDLRAKESIQPYTSGLAAIRELRPIKYRWTEATKLDRGRTYVGFGAQDVLPWLPDAVDRHWLPDDLDPMKIGRDEYSLNTHVIIAALVNAVRELEARLDAVDGKRAPSRTPTTDLNAAIGFDSTRLPPDEKTRRTGIGIFSSPVRSI